LWMTFKLAKRDTNKNPMNDSESDLWRCRAVGSCWLLVYLELMVVRGTLRGRGVFADLEHGFVVIVDDLYIAAKRRRDNSHPLSVNFCRIYAVNARTVIGSKVETDCFRNEFVIIFEIAMTDGRSDGRQVVFHIEIAGWMTTYARDRKRLRRHCQCFRSTKRSGDSRKILKGFQKFARVNYLC